MVGTRDEITDLLERVLSRAEGRRAEALYLGQDSALTRFANNQIHQNVREHDASLQVRIIEGESVGVAATNRLDDGGIADVIARATALAQRSAPNPRATVLPEPDGREHDPELGYVAATAEAGAELRGEGARAVIAAGMAKKLETAGSFSTGVMTMAVANTNGIRAVHRSTRAALLTVMMDGFASGAASGYAQAGAGDVRDIDAEAIGLEAADKGDRMRGAEAIEAGEYEVILEEYAVAGLLEYLSYIGFSGLAHEGRALVHGPRQARDGRERVDLGRRRRSERPALDDRLRGRGAPPGQPHPRRHRQCRGARRRHRVACRHRLDGARAPGTEPARPHGTQPVHGAGGDPARRADRRHQARHLGDALPLHQPRASEEGHPHRDDEGRHVPHRGWPPDEAAAELPVHAIGPGGVQRRASREPRDELLPGEFFGAARCPALHLGSFNFTGVTASEGGG